MKFTSLYSCSIILHKFIHHFNYLLIKVIRHFLKAKTAAQNVQQSRPVLPVLYFPISQKHETFFSFSTDSPCLRQAQTLCHLNTHSAVHQVQNRLYHLMADADNELTVLLHAVLYFQVLCMGAADE